jgi:integrase
MKLRWKQIDFGKRIFTITDTKNSEPLALPLSDFLYDLLAKRKEISRSEFVFPGKGDSGHIVEPKRQIQNITKASGVKSTIHDLRRTFITTAESLDIPAYALKALLNHKISGGGDVTQGYIVITPERLRHPMQKITDNILSTARAKESGKIIEISKSRKP